LQNKGGGGGQHLPWHKKRGFSSKIGREDDDAVASASLRGKRTSGSILPESVVYVGRGGGRGAGVLATKV